MSPGNNFIGPDSRPRGLDWATIGRAVLAPFIVWAAVVIVMVFVRHQPGVICITPVAWLMACWIGPRCVLSSRSGTRSARLKEAALAGGLFGLLQGFLFAAIMPFMGEIKPEERQKTVVLCAVMLVLGALISAGLSAAVGAAQDRRLATK